MFRLASHRLLSQSTRRFGATAEKKSSSTDDINKILSQSMEQARVRSSESRSQLQDMKPEGRVAAAQHVRNQKRFFPGDTYQPEDLAPLPEARRWRRVEQIENEDFFARRGIDIKAQYKNVALLSQYVNDLGQVYGRRQSGLSRENQRKLVRTLNMAINFGLIPRTKKHWSTLKQS